MRASDSLEAREAAMRKFVASKENVAKIRRHLQEILEGDEFRDRHRSGQFLSHILNRAIEGRFDSLKERLIGVELFGRAPSYDTGEDAIVRVAASDVRKRLLRHYGKYGATSPLRISLPAGCYVPEVHWANEDLEDSLSPAVPFAPEIAEPSAHLLEAAATASPLPTATAPASTASKPRTAVGWKLLAALLAILCAALGWTALKRPIPPQSLAASSPFWSAFLRAPHDIELITSDPNIAEIQELTGTPITVVDYANHRYIPQPNKLTPDEDRICRVILRGDKAASVDTPIAVKIAQLAQEGSRRVLIHNARSIQPSNLKTDDNYIVLGSPRSNPWSSIFSDQLDFRFAIDNQTHAEYIRNVHPRAHEAANYIPTAQGWQTGDSYAIIALLHNPDQNGLVLLIGGANGEGTEAAGKIVTDLPRLSTALQACGISQGGPLPQFEMLLHLTTMAGSSKNMEVVACHTLGGPAL